MARGKRRNSEPLATVSKPRWLKTFDRYGRELTSRRIEPMSDLRKVMSDEAARWAADGWVVENDIRWGEFYVNRRGERIQVLLAHADQPMLAHSSESFGPRES